MKKRLNVTHEELFCKLPGLYAVIHNNPPDYTVIDVTDAYLASTMLERQTAVGAKLFDLFPETPDEQNQDGIAALRETLETVAHTGQAHQQKVIRYDIRKPDGTFDKRFWQTTLYPVGDDAGVQGAILSTVDVTEYIRQQEAAQRQFLKNEERLRHIADMIPQIVWISDDQGNIEYFNQKWYELNDTPMGSNLAAAWNDVIHPDDAPDSANEWKACLAAGSPYEKEVRLRENVSQTYRWFVVKAEPIRDDEGMIRQWFGVCTDIDNQKNVEQQLEEEVAKRTRELEEKRANLARSNKELQNFAYVASHDLQEPLRKIQAIGNLLEEEYSSALANNDGDGLEYVRRMKHSAQRMSVLIEDLLAFSRITTHEKPAQPVNLMQIVGDVVDDLSERIKDVGAIVTYDNLPVVEADPTHMRQLMQNLISNALKFRKPDTAPHVTINGTYDKSINADIITVSDNGIGIDEKYAGRIFEMFQRLHGRNEYSGTGIGLAVCKKIVERYGGTITVSSTPGEGTTFIVTLPRTYHKEKK